MGVLNVYHPDIEKFITAKSYEAGILNHFNLSVMVDDKFVKNPLTENAELNLYKLSQAVHTAVRFLYNIIDINTFPSVIYENYQKR